MHRPGALEFPALQLGIGAHGVQRELQVRVLELWVMRLPVHRPGALEFPVLQFRALQFGVLQLRALVPTGLLANYSRFLCRPRLLPCHHLVLANMTPQCAKRKRSRAQTCPLCIHRRQGIFQLQCQRSRSTRRCSRSHAWQLRSARRAAALPPLAGGQGLRASSPAAVSGPDARPSRHSQQGSEADTLEAELCTTSKGPRPMP